MIKWKLQIYIMVKEKNKEAIKGKINKITELLQKYLNNLSNRKFLEI